MSALVVCVLVLFVAPVRGDQLAYEHWGAPTTFNMPIDVTRTAASDGFGFAPDRWRCSGGARI